MFVRAAVRLAAETAPLFAIVDGAMDPSISPMLRESGLQYQSLYEGEQGEELAPYGPYLVALPHDRAALTKWMEGIWGKCRGVHFACREAFPAVRRHLRRFLKVELEDGRRVYFRFYDPRVLRLFLPRCTYEEWTDFFGPVERYFIESEEGHEMLSFLRDADDPEPERSSLAA